jgi:predicted lactoylglutathione lyase
MVPQQQMVPQQRQTQQMNALELQIAQRVAKLVHESIENGDDPSDFVEKVTASAPPMVVKAIAAKSAEEVIAAIEHVAPRSAGTQMAGHRFVREAMQILRRGNQ